MRYEYEIDEDEDDGSDVDDADTQVMHTRNEEDDYDSCQARSRTMFSLIRDRYLCLPEVFRMDMSDIPGDRSIE